MAHLQGEGLQSWCRENATQRGQASIALTSTVAAARRYVAKAILGGGTLDFKSSFHLPTLRERLLSEMGSGAALRAASSPMARCRFAPDITVSRQP